MLSLLDILFPNATINLVKKLSPMKTIQPSINLWDKKETGACASIISGTLWV